MVIVIVFCGVSNPKSDTSVSASNFSEAVMLVMQPSIVVILLVFNFNSGSLSHTHCTSSVSDDSDSSVESVPLEILSSDFSVESSMLLSPAACTLLNVYCSPFMSNENDLTVDDSIESASTEVLSLSESSLLYLL